MKVVKVKLHWMSASEGGRLEPPGGKRYSTVARFNDIAEKWPKEAWSIVLEFTTGVGRYMEAKMWLLMGEEGPEEILHLGSQFDLFEGHKLVAHGEVIG